MKVLFLDIDGVLNSTRSAAAFGGYPHKLDQADMFDRVAIGLVQRLCQETGAAVCISSSWRPEYTAQEFADAFGVPVIGKTPYVQGPRGAEIAAWLAAKDDVERYAIVDDDGDMLPEQIPYFVQTSCAAGLSFADYEGLKAILGERRKQ